MSLNGNLEAFPLEEVLRLLARSKKNGCLRVEAEGTQGKVFVGDGAILFATTRGDDELRSDLLAAGLVAETDWPDVETRARTVAQALAPGIEPAALIAFVREQVVEALYRLRRPGHGNFDFAADVQPRYDTAQRVDVEVAVEEAGRRLVQWTEIEAVIPGMSFRLRMASSLPGDREITISPDTWKLVAALGGEGTVTGLAQGLGASEFQVARAMAALVRAGLVEVIDKLAGARSGYREPIEGQTEAARASTPSRFAEPSPAQADEEAEDSSFLSIVLTGRPVEDGAERFADPPAKEEAPGPAASPPPEQEPSPTIGLLRRRGLLRELSDGRP